MYIVGQWIGAEMGGMERGRARRHLSSHVRCIIRKCRAGVGVWAHTMRGVPRVQPCLECAQHATTRRVHMLRGLAGFGTLLHWTQ